MDERPAPLITISDPNRTAEPLDLLGSGDEKDPWRMTRRHWTALGTVAVLAAAAVVPQLVVGARADSRREATASRQSVTVTAGAGATDGDATALGLRLTNGGDEDLQVLDVTVTGPGYGAVRVDALLAANSARSISLVDQQTCGPALRRLDAAPRGAVVRVRTPRGDVVTRRVELPPELGTALLGSAQRRCGWLAPTEALRLGTFTPRRVGAGLELRGTATNTGKGVVRLVFAGAGFAGGIDVSLVGDGPLDVAEGATVPVAVLVTVNSCTDALPGIQPGQPEGLPLVTLSVASVDGNDDPVPSGDVVVEQGAEAVAALVRDRCRGTAAQEPGAAAGIGR